MQKFYTVLLWWIIAIPQGHAQSKTSFGFLVKAGNFALPAHNEKPSFNHDRDGSSITFRQKPGESYALGVWLAQSLGKNLSIQSEFLFNHSIERMETEQHTHLPEGSLLVPYSFTLHQKAIESGFSLPIKLQFKPQKHPKFSFAAGAGITHLLSASFFRTGRYQFEGFPVDKGSYLKQYKKWADFSYLFNVLADIHFMLDARTSIGLDYRYQKSSARYRDGLLPTVPRMGCDCDCGCDGYNTQIRPTMHSFSVSLRHNILN